MSASARGQSRAFEREQVRRSPELPVLAAVSKAVDIAIAVLKIQHPFLAGTFSLDDVCEPLPIMLAEIVRLHAVALREAIDRYREVAGPFPELPGDDYDPF